MDVIENYWTLDKVANFWNAISNERIAQLKNHVPLQILWLSTRKKLFKIIIPDEFRSIS